MDIVLLIPEPGQQPGVAQSPKTEHYESVDSALDAAEKYLVCGVCGLMIYLGSEILLENNIRERLALRKKKQEAASNGGQ